MKYFQKSATTLHELTLPHIGIIDSETFHAHYELHCYAPSAELAPFVEHIWTQRPRRTPATFLPKEIYTGPQAYLFLSQKDARIHGVSSAFHYDPRNESILAGVKFRPGGFFPFLAQPLHTISEKVIDASPLFPEFAALFGAELAQWSDEVIVSHIEATLKARQPLVTQKLHTITAVMAIIEAHPDISCTQLAVEAAISERSLQTLFREYIGVSIKWVLMRQRLLRALEQTRLQTKREFASLAFELGYSSHSHLTREFTRVVGVTPRDYRRLTTPNNASL